MKRSTVAICRISCPRLLESRDGPDAVTELLAHLTKHEPGRGIARCQLEGLREQIDGSGKITLGLAVARPFEAAVGNQIARRQMDRLWLQILKPRFLARRF